jgi:hypothetical protein
MYSIIPSVADFQALIQRTMISTWAIELFLDKLNSLEDSATNSSNAIIQKNIKSETEIIRSEFQDFIMKHKVPSPFPRKKLIRVERFRSSNNLRFN